jgi:tripartite-type tricarboxylate transporter receptor subunit TctC
MPAIDRRHLVRGAVMLGGAALATPAWPQAYPQRPVKLIVPYAPGGGTDVFSRLLAAQIERAFGQPLVIDNRAGGASILGTQAVANAPADGYTIAMVDSAFVTNPGLFGDKLPYDTRKDFVPVSLLSRTQLVLAVHPSSPFNTAQELVAAARASPGRLTFASAGIGTGIHLAGEQFRQATGIEVVVVPYRGGAAALADFLAAKVDFTFGSVPTIKEYVAAGRARALGVTRGRSPQMPDVPGMDEIGFGNVDSSSEMGLVVPAATPPAIVARLQQISADAVKSAAFSQRLLDAGFQPIGTTSEEFRAHIDREIDKWTKITTAGNVKPE